jgi:hypothetical protein
MVNNIKTDYHQWRDELARERSELLHPSNVLEDPEGVTRRIAEIDALLEAGAPVKAVLATSRREAQRRQLREARQRG